MAKLARRILVAGVAIVAAALSVASVASADVWSTDGVNPFAGPAHVEGSLTTTVNANGLQTSCDVTGTLDLGNAGVAPWDQAHGQVTTFTTANCTTTLANCTVTPVSNARPWTVDTAGASVTVTGTNFVISYAGAACALNGVSVSTAGNVTGNLNGDDVEFVGAPGLVSPLWGPLTLDGVINITAEATGDPVTLIP